MNFQILSIQNLEDYLILEDITSEETQRIRAISKYILNLMTFVFLKIIELVSN